MVVRGYRIHDKDLSNIYMELDTVRKRINKTAAKEYHKMLGEEIAFICDNIALGSMQRDKNISIYNSAIGNLQFKMNNALNMNAPTRYNMACFVFIMPYEDYTYIKLECKNEMLWKAFDKLEEYSLTEEESKDSRNQKAVIWQAVHKLYSECEPMVLKLTPELKPDKDSIVIPPKKERVELHARHSVMNHLLNQISGGKEIAPILLMSYMDLMLEMMETRESKVLYKQKAANLSQILLNLTKEDEYIYNTDCEG